MLTQELISVILSTLLAIALGISIFAGNSKDKLTWKQVILMVIVGMTAGVVSWTYLKEGLDTKTIVRNILCYTFLATVFTKLIGRVINAITNIPEADIQHIVIDFARKKAGLDEYSNNTDNGSNQEITPTSDSPIAPDNSGDSNVQQSAAK